MRAPPMLALAAALLAAMAPPAWAANHYVPEDEGVTYPEPEEATERGPRNDPAVSWVPAGLALLFLGLAAAVIVTMRRWFRRDHGR